jgi:ELWxxDGT repeat protein
MPGVDLLARGLRASRRAWAAILRVFAFAAIAGAVAPVSLADTPHLLLDINAQSDAVHSKPVPLGRLGSSYLFGAQTSQSGASAVTAALFITDSTAAGTIAIRSFDGDGPVDSTTFPRFLISGSRAYFVASETATGQALWITDGTAAGTQKVADTDGSGAGIVRPLGLLGADLLFIQKDALGTVQLYRTDGTSAGTQALTNFGFSNGPSGEARFVNGRIYFVAGPQTLGTDNDLWVSDGTPGGTHAVANATHLPNGPGQASLTVIDSSALLFIARHATAGLEIHRLDLSNDAVTVIDLNPTGDGVIAQTRIVGLNGVALFAGTNQNPFSEGLELWRTDGTLAGTSRVLDINPGAPGAFDEYHPMLMQRVGNRALFYAMTGSGPQLWSSDGTPGNTVALTTAPGALGNQLAFLGATGSYAYFSSPVGGLLFGDTIHRIIATDGTAAGTKTLQTGLIRNNEVPSQRFAGDDNVAYVKAYMFDPVRTQFVAALYKYEPAADRTTNLGVLDGDYPVTTSMGLDGSRVFFSAYTRQAGIEPYVLDAGGTGFTLLKNIALETTTNDATPGFPVEFNGKLLFTANDGIHGIEPWQSDGTAAGTTLLADISPNGASTNVDLQYVWNGALFFFIYDGVNPGIFVRWDGTTAQTLAQISPPPLFNGPIVLCARRFYAQLGSKLYFAAMDPTGDTELLVTDGTPQGTTRAVDVNPTPLSSYPCGVMTYKDRLYFGADGGGATGGKELWSSDGTPAGTTRVADITPGASGSGAQPTMIYNNELYFIAASQLWKTDGTTAGTRVLVETSSGPPFGSVPVGIVKGRLMMMRPLNTLPAEYELWTSDGTAAGTVQLTGMQIPALSNSWVVAGNFFYFFAAGPTGGVEPWMTDGTQAGTRMLADLNPNGDSTRNWMVSFGGVVTFAATDSINGSRVWRSDGTTAGTVALGSIPAGSNYAFVAGQSVYFAVNEPTLGREYYVLRNERPVAGNDSGASANGASVSLTVLGNDADVDGTIDGGSVRIVTAPAHGTATVGANGAITYVPTAGYGGTDSFSYSVADNQGYQSSPATVTLTVTAAPGSGGSNGGGGGGGGGGGALGLLELMGLLGCLGVGWHRARRGRGDSLG